MRSSVLAPLVALFACATATPDATATQDRARVLRTVTIVGDRIVGIQASDTI